MCVLTTDGLPKLVGKFLWVTLSTPSLLQITALYPDFVGGFGNGFGGGFTSA